MNVCLSTVTAVRRNCMPLRHAPAHRGFYFWCFTVTSQRKSGSWSICNKLCKHVIQDPYYRHEHMSKCFLKGFPYNSLLEWTLRIPLTSKHLENNLFKKFNSHFIYTSHISLATGWRQPLPPPTRRAGVQSRRKGFTNSFPVPVSHAVSWPKSRPGLGGYFGALCRDRLASGPPARRLVSAQLASH